MPHSGSPHDTVIQGLVTAFSDSVGISSCCTAQFLAPSLNILKSAHHHIPSGPAVNMALVDQVLHVMTPAEWGKPIDVDEKWIAFVDDNVKASTCFLILMLRAEAFAKLKTHDSASIGQRGGGYCAPRSKLLDQNG